MKTEKADYLAFASCIPNVTSYSVLYTPFPTLKFAHVILVSFPFRETNLKFKMALEITHQCLQEESSLATFDGLCKYVFLLFSH